MSTGVDTRSDARPALKAVIDRLRRDRRNTALGGVLATFAVIVAAIGVAALSRTWLAWSCASIVIGLMQYRLVMSCHEAVHKTLLFPVGLNELVGSVHGALVGLNFHRYRSQHLAHHRAERVAEDPDAYIYRPILERAPGLPRAMHWVLGTFAEIAEKVRQKGLSLDSEPEDARGARVDSALMVALHAALFSLFALTLGWWAYVVLWFSPVVMVAVFVNRTRVFIEHGYWYSDRALGGDISDAPVRTIDLASNPIERFFVAPYSFNHHQAHHASPMVPHYNLPELSALLESGEAGYAPRVRASYARLLWALLAGRGAILPRDHRA